MTFMRKPVLLRKADLCSVHVLQGIANKGTFHPAGQTEGEGVVFAG